MNPAQAFVKMFGGKNETYKVGLELTGLEMSCLSHSLKEALDKAIEYRDSCNEHGFWSANITWNTNIELLSNLIAQLEARKL